MKPRVLSSLFFAGLIGLGLYVFPLWIFSLGTTLFIAAGLFEFFTMLRAKGEPVHRLFGVVIGTGIPLVVHFQLGSGRSGEVLFIVLACFGLFLIQFSRKDIPNALEGIALTLFGIMYVSWFLSFILKIRFDSHGNDLIAYILLVTKSSDVGAYLAGTRWGKHTLIPHISPRKTLEGTVGGIVASVLFSVALGGLLPFGPSLLERVVLGVLIGLAAECGDLSESLIKRACGAKDSGTRIPGFGGFLDLMDSVLFTVPLFYFYLETR